MPSYKIAELSFGSSRWNSVRQFNVDGVDFEIQRIGVESCTETLKRMIERLRSFGEVQPSYKPGVKLGDLAPALPAFAIEAMREALPAFGRKIKGYDMPDAMLTGVETRTSSPLRITRGEDFQSLNTAASTRPARVRATRAASCRPGWTASRWPRR